MNSKFTKDGLQGGGHRKGFEEEAIRASSLQAPSDQKVGIRFQEDEHSR